MTERPLSGRNPGSTEDEPPASPTRALRGGSGRAILRGLIWLLAAGLLLAAAGWGVRVVGQAGVPVTVAVDGVAEVVRSARPDVAALLADLGLSLRPADRLEPSLDTPLRPGLAVTVMRARPALISVDGTLREIYTRAATVGEVVVGAGLRLAPRDEVWLDGLRVSAGAPVPAAPQLKVQPRYAAGRAWDGREPAPIRLSIRRAVPIVVDDGSVPYTVFTTAATVGEALLQEQVTLYLGDRVQPSPGSRVRSGLRVRIERSKPVIVTVDGRTVQTRTRGKTVGAALLELGILVAGSDRVAPALDQPVIEHLPIRVVRVADLTLVEREAIPYESVMVPDDALEIDSQRLAQAGRDGEFRRRWQVIYEDGVEVTRTLLDEWVAAQPTTRMVAYGRKLVSRTLETPEGTLTYWRKIRMYATSYSPGRAGTPITAPWYGRTRIGLRLRKGIVAVDPNVIPLQTMVYVPGYGVAIAGDTGGGVRGKWIDMGYEDHDYISWHWWTDVYILDPPPAPNRITWVLPNYPPPGFPRRR